VAKLPIDLSGREVRMALERAGFVLRRQSGSHMILRRDDPHSRVVVPDHKQLGRALSAALLPTPA
jgi:predicted RNA binding protein YcfA (HicA-like mRNA interferase family)